MSFDPTKPVQTKDGKPARIICTDRMSRYPIAALIMLGEYEEIFSYTEGGQRRRGRDDDSLNLVNVPEEKTGWVGIDEFDNAVGMFSSEAEAQERVKKGRPVLRIEWEE